MPDDAYTEQPAQDVTPAPPMMLLILWVPVFAVIAWGMMLLMGRRPYEFGGSGPVVPVAPRGTAEAESASETEPEPPKSA